MKQKTLYDILKKTPQGRVIIAHLQKGKTAAPLLGKTWFQKIGKYTHNITGAIAKHAAGLIGIPPGAIDALAKADPTAHNSLVSSLVNSTAGKKAANFLKNATETAKETGTKAENVFSKIKPVYLVAGAGTIAAVIFFVAAKKKRKG